MNKGLTTFFLVPVLVLAAACRTGCADENVSAWTGLVINEIAAHDETTDAETWVELLNGSGKSLDISGTGLYLTDQYFNAKCIYTAPDGTVLDAGARLVLSTADETLVTGIASDSDFSLKIAKGPSCRAIDEFKRDKVFDNASSLTARGSYQRIPDGGSAWRNLSYSSRGMENSVFDLDKTRRNAIWVWSSHIPSLMENGCAELKSLKTKGIDHIILNYAAFNPSSRARSISFIESAEKIGRAHV